MGFVTTIYNSYLSRAYSLPAPPDPCFVTSDLGLAVTKVKYTFFLFLPF
jgi:hypothetical protein